MRHFEKRARDPRGGCLYLLKLSLRPWRLALWSQVFSALAVGFLLVLAGFLFWMQDGLRTVVLHLKGEQVITAYLQPSLDAQAESRVLDQVREVVGDQSGVVIHLVGQSEFLDGLKDSYPELVRDLKDLGQEMNPIVPRYVSITGMLSDTVVNSLRKVPGIEAAETSGDRFRPIVGAFSALRWLARVIMLGICFALFSGLIQLARMNGYLHRDALGILRLWGANSISLMTPGLISGVLVGSLGGALAAFGWLTFGATLGGQIRLLSPVLNRLPPFSMHLAWVLFLTGSLLGLLAGALGGFSQREEGILG